MKKYLFFTVAILFGVCLFSCKSIDSETKGGVLNQFEDAILLQLPPNGTVTICSDNNEVGDNVKRAIYTWASAIERDSYISVDTHCSDNADVTLKVSKDTEAQTAHTEPDKGIIFYKDVDTYGQFPVMLHEVGHNWGLCDQYYGGLRNCDNIRTEEVLKKLPDYKNETTDRTSVMGGNYNNYLSDDDKALINAISRFESAGKNKEWNKFLLNKHPYVQTTRKLFNPSCIDQGYISVSNPDINGTYYVYVSTNCYDPRNMQGTSVVQNQNHITCKVEHRKLGSKGYVTKVTPRKISGSRQPTQIVHVVDSCNGNLQSWQTSN